MIGQYKIRNYLDDCIAGYNLPQFIILIGSKGSGRSMIAKYIAESVGAVYSMCGIKVDEIREVIDTAYKTSDKVVYHVKDADTMRAEAKNAMLKITEEPPKNAYFIMSVQNDSSLLNTIKSRAHVFYMQPYTRGELCEYATKYPKSDIIDISVDIATTPYQLDLLVKYGKDFIDYVQLVLDNIADVEPANAFKSSSKLALKDEADKYDLDLFFRTFCKLCDNKIYSGLYENQWADASIITSCYLDRASKLGVNKNQLYDSWVFKIREVLYHED